MGKVLSFPKGFMWGSATSSYQVEGGIYNNNWAEAAREGEVPRCGDACDHFRRYENDFQTARELGHNAHRLSIEWARVEPDPGQFNHQAIAHYRKVIQSLKDQGMEPFVTCWHFTIPQWFAERNGFEEEDAHIYFARYCRFLVAELGDLVTFWITVNEPMVYANQSYIRSNWPPFRRSLMKFFAVLDQMGSAHRVAYREMKKVNPDIQIGIAKHNINVESNWNPVNKIMASLTEWFFNSRFLREIGGYQDFIGLNYYIHSKIGDSKKYEKTDMGWNIYPQGLYRQLKLLKQFELPVYITENGLADSKDSRRWMFIKDHLIWTHKAIEQGVDVRGYFYWSLLDNYEWSYGFEKRFGLIAVDFETQERHVRSSALHYKEVCKHNQLQT